MSKNIVDQNLYYEVLETKVTVFLAKYGKNERAIKVIAPFIAKTSLKENHLYQDLGFKNRIEMGKYMNEHFPKLSEIKPKDKLWKKFIYDSVGEVAPACEFCKDSVNCFSCKV